MSLNNRNCSVFGCTSRKGKNPDISFHRFPPMGRMVNIENKFGVMENVSQRKAWVMKLKMGKPVTDHMYVCSLHFKREDYYNQGLGKKKYLLLNAVPTLKLPQSSYEVCSRKRKRPKSRTENSSTIEVVDNVSNLFEVDEISNATCSTPEREGTDQIVAAEALVQLQDSILKTKFSVDCATQVKSGDLIEPFSTRITSTKEMLTLTGLPSFELLNTIVELVTELFPKNRKKHTVMTVKDEIIFTLMKLKTAIQYNVLSLLFSVSEPSCRVIFHETLVKLAKVLQYAITWPSKEEILQNMPLCFKGFEKVRVVLDCTEIPLQQSKCLCCRLKTYSHYKKRHTVKILTGVSPAGLVTYISKAYGGRTSDSEIFKQSSILHQCDRFLDHIMVDKGFLIEDLVESEGVKLIRPPFLRKRDQFSHQEALLNVRIARARVHVERTNQRIKVFEILTKPFPLSLLSQVDNVLIIICAIVNLSNPIFGEDKF